MFEKSKCAKNRRFHHPWKHGSQTRRFDGWEKHALGIISALIRETGDWRQPSGVPLSDFQDLPHRRWNAANHPGGDRNTPSHCLRDSQRRADPPILVCWLAALIRNTRNTGDEMVRTTCPACRFLQQETSDKDAAAGPPTQPALARLGLASFPIAEARTGMSATLGTICAERHTHLLAQRGLHWYEDRTALSKGKERPNPAIALPSTGHCLAYTTGPRCCTLQPRKGGLRCHIVHADAAVLAEA
ncbi:hypothetical protein B0J18DRAFT_134586 [Chaetomium sp. MPI-SDFR-AT-0129]|nr:hypothetical protein B0J18DRAFT_134586 [Chaetomium sp. MPI-SDFR-AT-0129]